MHPLNHSKLPNAAVISFFQNITWPTGDSIHSKTLKVGKIHRYIDICKLPKPSNF